MESNRACVFARKCGVSIESRLSEAIDRAVSRGSSGKQRDERTLLTNARHVIAQGKQKIIELELERDNLKATAGAVDSIVGELQGRLLGSSMGKDTKRLAHHFRNVDVYEGQRGDLDNASPGQSAIRVMAERKKKIRELEAERKAILTMLGPDYVGEFEVGDKQRPLDSLVSEVLSQLRRAVPIITERDRQDAKWGPQDHTLPVWITILMEEVGELAAAALGHTFGTDKHPNLNWRKEAVQVAAVALAMLEEYND